MSRRYVMGERRARMEARLQRLWDLAPPCYEPCSPELSRAFVRQYEREVHLAYQRTRPAPPFGYGYFWIDS
jgi:hypothetical protein